MAVLLSMNKPRLREDQDLTRIAQPEWYPGLLILRAGIFPHLVVLGSLDYKNNTP